jgi:DNA excision repair protein ERCC-6
LKDPKQRQTFQMKDLYDLFTLGSTEDGTTETSEMFKGTEVQFKQDPELVPPTDSSLRNKTVTSPTTIKREVHGDDEILNFDGVSSLEVFRGGPDEDKPADSEARLMEGIFANSGVHSALEHDQIINGKKKIAADRGMLEREAKKIAAEAAQQLRRAGETARSVAPGTVTWTGEFGSAGRPVNTRRGAGPSSNGILSSLANRQGISNNASASSSRSGTPAATERAPRGKDFMKLIQNFIRTHGGKVPTAMLVNHFNNMCKTPQQSTEFKHMLREIAILEEGPGRMMRAKWVLKPEFK